MSFVYQRIEKKNKSLVCTVVFFWFPLKPLNLWVCLYLPWIPHPPTMGCHLMLTENANFVTNALRCDLSTGNVRPWCGHHTSPCIGWRTISPKIGVNFHDFFLHNLVVLTYFIILVCLKTFIFDKNHEKFTF